MPATMPPKSSVRLGVNFGGAISGRAEKRTVGEDEDMVLILLLLLLMAGGFTYYAFRNYGRYGGLVPVMVVILLIYLLVGTHHFH
jgi:hypothetical protein